MRTVAVTAVLALCLAAPLAAATVYIGLEPGWATRADAVRALGEPVRTLASVLLEFKPQEGTGPIFAELRADGSGFIDRIEVRFAAPVARQALVDALKLPAAPAASEVNSTGHLVEYFGENLAITLTYAGDDGATGATAIGYFSDVLFERESARAASAPRPTPKPANPPGPAGGTGAAAGPGSTSAPGSSSAPSGPPLASTVPPSIKRDPLACYDLYTWAQTQEAAAKAAKQTTRRQLAVDIRIAAQAGDCDRAKKLVADYRKQFGGLEPRDQ